MCHGPYIIKGTFTDNLTLFIISKFINLNYSYLKLRTRLNRKSFSLLGNDDS